MSAPWLSEADIGLLRALVRVAQADPHRKPHIRERLERIEDKLHKMRGGGVLLTPRVLSYHAAVDAGAKALKAQAIGLRMDAALCSQRGDPHKMEAILQAEANERMALSDSLENLSGWLTTNGGG